MTKAKFKPGDVVRFKGGQDEWIVRHGPSKARDSVTEGYGIEHRKSSAYYFIHEEHLELVRRPKPKVKRTGWVNIYPFECPATGVASMGSTVWATKEIAHKKLKAQTPWPACKWNGKRRPQMSNQKLGHMNQKVEHMDYKVEQCPCGSTSPVGCSVTGCPLHLQELETQCFKLCSSASVNCECNTAQALSTLEALANGHTVDSVQVQKAAVALMNEFARLNAQSLPKASDESLAEEIIYKLDAIARDYDSYEFGLPLYGEFDRMKRAVIEILTSRQSLPQAASTSVVGELIEAGKDLTKNMKIAHIDVATGYLLVGVDEAVLVKFRKARDEAERLTLTSGCETAVDRETFNYMVKTNNEWADKARAAENRIAELERMLASEQTRLHEQDTYCVVLQERIASLEKERDELKAALEHIAMPNSCHLNDTSRMQIAAEALAKLEGRKGWA